MSMPRRVRAPTWRPPLPRTAGPRRRRSSTPGRSSWTRSHPPPASDLPQSAERKVSALVWRAHIPDTYAAPAPDQQPGRILIPATEQPGIDKGGSEQPRLPGNSVDSYATPAGCPVSTTSCRYDLRRTCRLVTGRSHRPRSTWPNLARLPLLTVTHRYKRTHCLRLEQFQIAESVCLGIPVSVRHVKRREASSVRGLIRAFYVTCPGASQDRYWQRGAIARVHRVTEGSAPQADPCRAGPMARSNSRGWFPFPDSGLKIRSRQHQALAACNSPSARRATSLNSSPSAVSLQRS